ncbi:MAG: Rrf2 family transcriptional regulator [Lachnospiraceae bacterium]|nr:Rrf2 family transcriptional regulator [Lachnospiraceae bacterium]
MRVSTKGRYALRMMLDLAKHQNDGYISLGEIAERQEISKKYLEQIVPLLGHADFLLTSRGFQGGYRLARPASDYTVKEILRLTEGSLAPVTCVSDNPATCERSADCPTLPLWQGLNKVIDDYLSGITLQDLADGNLS